MLGFMPSEIARLVLGYLQETGCEDAVKQFLCESEHLKEYAQCLEAGLRYPTEIQGRGLTTMLQDYYELTHLNLQNSIEGQRLISNLESSVNQVKQLLIPAPNHKTNGLNKILNRNRPIFKAQQNTRNTSFTRLRERKKIQERQIVRAQRETSAPNVVDEERSESQPSTSRGINDGHLLQVERYVGVSSVQRAANHASSVCKESNVGTPLYSALQIPSYAQQNKQLSTQKNTFDRSTSPYSPAPLHSPSESNKRVSSNYSAVELTESEINSDLCTKPQTSNFAIPPRSDDLCSNIQTSNVLPENTFHIHNPFHHSTTDAMGKKTIFSTPAKQKHSNHITFSAFPGSNLHSDEASGNPKTNESHRNSALPTIENPSPLFLPEKSSPLNLSCDREPICSNGLTHILANHEQNRTSIPVIDLDSPHHSNQQTPENHFLGASSQATPTSKECPESPDMPLRENASTSDTISRCKQLQATEFENTSVASPEAEEAWRIISLEKERLKNCDRLNSPASHRIELCKKKNGTPNKSLNSPNISSSGDSPFRSTMLNSCSTINSPSTTVLSPAFINPINSVEPELPARHPDELTSLQLALTQQRSTVYPLATPVKDHHQALVNQNGTANKSLNLPIISSNDDSPYHNTRFNTGSITNSPSTTVLSPALITPINSVEPELPARRPDELTSFRHTLTQQRSTAYPLATPVKDYHQALVNQQGFFSPKRKSIIPKRRLASITSPTVRSDAGDGNATHNDDIMDFELLLEEVINYPSFISKLTENINKVKAGDNTPEKVAQSAAIPGSPQIPEVHIPDNVIKDILAQTESDPVFEEVLSLLCEKHVTNRDHTNFHAALSSDELVSNNLEQHLDESIPFESSPHHNPELLTSADKSHLNPLTKEDQHQNKSIAPTAPPTVISESSLVKSSENTNILTPLPIPALPLVTNLIANTIVSGSSLPLANCSGISSSSSRPNGFRTILPSPKKDLLQRTLESLQIQASPVKNGSVGSITHVTSAQNVDYSNFGTCIQVLNQPIMSSKQANTYVLNGTSLTPVKLSFPGLNVLTLSPGQFYTRSMTDIFTGSQVFQENNQQLPVIMQKNNDLPVIISSGQYQDPNYLKRNMTRRSTAVKMSHKDRVKLNPKTMNQKCSSILPKNHQSQPRSANAHVRSLDFGQSAAEVTEPVPEDNCAPITRSNSKAKKLRPNSEQPDSGVKTGKPVVYISASGKQKRVSTIDMSQLDLLRDSSSSSASSHVNGKFPAGSSDTESAAATLLTLSQNSFATSKTKKDYTRLKKTDRSLQLSRKRKCSPEKGNKVPSKDLLKKMDIDKFLSTVHD